MLPSAPPAGDADPSRPDAQDPPELWRQQQQQEHQQQPPQDPRRSNGLAGGDGGGSVSGNGSNPLLPPGRSGGGTRVRTIDAELEALRDKGIASESRTKFNSSHTDLDTMEDWYLNLRHQEEEIRRKKMDAERVLHSYQNNEFVPTSRCKPPPQQHTSSPSPTAHLEGSESDDDRLEAELDGPREASKDISPIISRFDQLSREGEQYLSIGTSSSNLASAVLGAEEEEEEEVAGGWASEDLQERPIDAASGAVAADQIKPAGAALAPASESKSVSPDAALVAASAAAVPVAALEERNHPVTRGVEVHGTTEGSDDFRYRQQQQQQQQQRPSPVTPSADATGAVSTRSVTRGGSEACVGISAAPNVGGIAAPSAPSPAPAPVNVPVRVSLGVLVRERDAEALLRFPVEDMRAHQSSSSSLGIVENVLATMTEVVRVYCASLGDGGLASTAANRRGSDVGYYDPMFAPTIAGVERDAGQT